MCLYFIIYIIFYIYFLSLIYMLKHISSYNLKFYTSFIYFFIIITRNIYINIVYYFRNINKYKNNILISHII